MSENNNIPKHWKVVELKNVISILGDGLHGTPKYTDNGDYFFINGNNLSNGKIIIKNETKRVSKEEYEKYKKPLNDRTILVSINGTLGNVAFYKDEKVILGKSACFFNLLDYVDKNFIRLLLSGQEFLNFTQNIATGSTIKNVSLKSMREFKFPLPPLPEQQAIVAKIEELFSHLENGKQQLQTTQQQLKVYRQSLLKWAFEGKLTNKNVKDGELPEGWKWVMVSDVCLKIIGGGTPSTKIDKYWNGDIPWISSADIYGINNIIPRRKITGDAIENSATNLLPKGGIIVVTRVGLGKLAVAPFDITFSQDSQGLILNYNLITTEYALWVLHQQVQIFKHQSRGTTINGVTKKQLADLMFPLPPLEEQKLIVDELESKLTICDKIEETISQSLQQAEALRQSILKKAFEGKLM